MAGVQFIEVIALGRIVGPEVFGLIAMVLLLSQWLRTVTRMGLPEAVIQAREPTKEQISTVYWVGLLAASGIAVLVVVAAPAAAWLFRMPELRALLPVTAIAVLLDGLGSQFDALRRRRLEFDLLAVVEITAAVMGATVSVVSAAVWNQGAWAAVWGLLVRTGIRSVILASLGFAGRDRPKLCFEFGQSFPMIRFGAYRAAAMGLNAFHGRVDQLLVGGLLGAQALGLYSMAFNLVRQPVTKINQIVTSVAYPLFSTVQTDAGRLKRAYVRMVRSLVTVNAPVVMLLATVGPLILPVLLGDEWIAAGILISIFAVYGISTSIGNASGTLIWAVGHARWSFYWNLALAAAKPAVLVPAALFLQDLQLFSITFVALHIFLLAANYLMRVRVIVGPLLREFSAALVPPLAFAVAGAMVISLVSTFGIGSGIVSAGILSIIGLTVYAVLLAFLAPEFIRENIALFLSRRTSSAAVD